MFWGDIFALFSWFSSSSRIPTSAFSFHILRHCTWIRGCSSPFQRHLCHSSCYNIYFFLYSQVLPADFQGFGVRCVSDNATESQRSRLEGTSRILWCSFSWPKHSLDKIWSDQGLVPLSVNPPRMEIPRLLWALFQGLTDTDLSSPDKQSKPALIVSKTCTLCLFSNPNEL